jgi:hypothetical protein
MGRETARKAEPDKDRKDKHGSGLFRSKGNRYEPFRAGYTGGRYLGADLRNVDNYIVCCWRYSDDPPKRPLGYACLARAFSFIRRMGFAPDFSDFAVLAFIRCVKMAVQAVGVLGKKSTSM